MIRSLLFLLRLLLAWGFVAFMPLSLGSELAHENVPDFLLFVAFGLLGVVAVAAFSHIRRVRLVAGELNASTLSNRQRRQIEIPFEAGEAFDLLAAAIAELPGVESVTSARDSLQVRAKLKRIDPYGGQPRISPNRWLRVVRNQILAWSPSAASLQA
ncbi:MAG: sensor histidine kinase, partial [Arenimonas sp.]